MPRPSSRKKGGAKAPSTTSSSPRRRRVRAETGPELPGLDEGSLSRRIAELERTLGELPPDPEPSPGREPSTVPKSLVKFIVGLFLLPVAWILSAAFVRSLSLRIISSPFGFLLGGAVLFGILFAVLPRKALMLPYVFGHEVTHAIWVKLFGGKVDNRFHVSEEGGHVLTDRVNTWIALSPYFFPFYSVLAATLWGALWIAARIIGNADLVRTIASLDWCFFLLTGMTLAHHLLFTVLLIAKGQPDLHYGGSFFSVVLIYCINLSIITALLIATSRAVPPALYADHVMESAVAMIEFLRQATDTLLSWIGEIRRSFAS